MYITSKIPLIVKEYNEREELGRMYIVDESGKVLMGGKNNESMYIPPQILNQDQEVYKKAEKTKTLNYIVSKIGTTNWKIINVVETNELLGTFNKISLAIMGISTLLFSLFFLYSRMFLKNIIMPVTKLSHGMELMEHGDLHAHVEASGAGEIRKLIHSFNRMARQIKELIISNEQKERQKHEEEIKALQLQINPHFLVNTLNSIRFIAMAAKFDSIKNMAEALTKILSCSFKSESSFYKVSDEIEMLESYVYLMKIRYSDNFKVDFEIDENCLNYMVPRLIIQPIVENSIVHGLESLEDVGVVQVKVYEDNQELIFEISDNGQGMEKDRIRGLLSMNKEDRSSYKGIGVANVNRRIKLNYGDRYGIKMYSELGKYTRTCINMPIIYQGDEENV